MDDPFKNSPKIQFLSEFDNFYILLIPESCSIISDTKIYFFETFFIFDNFLTKGVYRKKSKFKKKLSLLLDFTKQLSGTAMMQELSKYDKNWIFCEGLSE